MKISLSTSIVLFFIHKPSYGQADTQVCTLDQSGSQVCTSNNTNNETINNYTDENDPTFYCDIWAFRGECTTNPSYMLSNCLESCERFSIATKSKSKAFDFTEKCPKYAELGECEVNPRYMREFCSKSCNEVGKERIKRKTMREIIGVKQSRLAVSSSKTCQLFMAESSIPNSGLGMYTAVPIEKGELVFHPEIVVIYFDSAIHAERKFFNENRQKDDWDEVFKDKEDQHEKCKSWAIHGECEANPVYMLSKCTKSCALFKAGILNKEDQHEKCKSWAIDGECDVNPVYMLSNCTKSCALFKAGILNKEDQHPKCKSWAIDGECEANPVYMLSKCTKSCALFKAGTLNKDDKDSYNWLPDNYYWESSATDSSYDAANTDSLTVGLGALANSHTGLKNVIMLRPSIDNSGLHRSKDPGVGAFSMYHNLGWKATKTIPAGMEIFAEYGDDWFKSREKKFGKIPLSKDFEAADRLVKKFWSIVSEKDEFAQDLLTLMKELPKREHVRMVLPTTIEMAKKARATNAAMLSVPNVIRSKEWLHENGICLDNIRPDQSTIIQAGRGAFATRSLSKGDIIAPLPLIHMEKERLAMYKEVTHGSGCEREHDQLLLNYCYGHPNSTLVMFPYSPITNFVNHNFNHSAINAEVQWSKSRYHKAHWLNMTVDEIISEPYAGLMLEFVALRDINEGEEIFINYGQEWESAWEKHIDEWKPPKGDYYPPTYQLNQMTEIRTMEEQKTQPYSPDIMTICMVKSRVMKDESQTVDWSKYSIHPDHPSSSFKCNVMKRGNGGFYEVKVQADDFEESNVEKIVVNVPRHAIEFVYKPYKSDHHLKNTFRHHISLPNEIFPSQWMDIL